MKINKIELFNIGSYEGLNTFDITGQNPKGKISVIGGKNGAGKTTLFTGIKLCLYGCKEAGYEAINRWYKDSIKKLINDKSKLENDACAYVALNVSIFNGQDWDEYQLKRTWSISAKVFETYEVVRNRINMTLDEIDDFENYIMNLIPPELFELYFFDGEQIADYFLEEGNGSRLKSAFLTICGYDTFDILYKNFKRIGKKTNTNDSALLDYFSAEEKYKKIESELEKCKIKIESLSNSIEEIETEIVSLEKRFKSRGGVSLETWNGMFLELKNEERIRDEKNVWLKTAANEIIPYLIMKKQLMLLYERMQKEDEIEKKQMLEVAVKDTIPRVFTDVMTRYPAVTKEIRDDIITLVIKEISSSNDVEEPILCLSKSEYRKLSADLSKLLSYSSEDVIKVKKEVKASLARSQKCREKIELSNVSEIDSYLNEKEALVNKKDVLINERNDLYELQKELTNNLSKEESAFKVAKKNLEKHLKGESIADLTTKSVVFLEALQKKLFMNEIVKVQKLFMMKINQLMRKKQFICDVLIDEDFNIRVYKKVRVDVGKICERIKRTSVDAYIEEFGNIHCQDVLSITKCSNFEDFLERYSYSDEVVEVVMELDKGTMSKGEKQVFIMALYWSIMQLCNKDIPFIIDTPFARIDTVHRAHITEFFFKELKGQVFIFSTDEEITAEHMEVIGDDLQSKFLIENTDNKRTSIKANAYFGE